MMDDVVATTRAWIIEVRAITGKTQGDLAAFFGLARATVNRWERGQVPIPAWYLDWCGLVAERKRWPPPLAQRLSPPSLDGIESATEDEAAEVRQMEAIFTRALQRRARIEAVGSRLVF